VVSLHPDLDEALVAEIQTYAQRIGCVIATDGKRVEVLPQPLPAGWRAIPFREKRAA
jgi:predicted ATPase